LAPPARAGACAGLYFRLARTTLSQLVEIRLIFYIHWLCFPPIEPVCGLFAMVATDPWDYGSGGLHNDCAGNWVVGWMARLAGTGGLRPFFWSDQGFAGNPGSPAEQHASISLYFLYMAARDLASGVRTSNAFPLAVGAARFPRRVLCKREENDFMGGAAGER